MKLPPILKKKRVLLPLGALVLAAAGVKNPGPILEVATVAVEALKGNSPN